ncbi:TetR/AcrR family transcriptional regulator [Pseudoxanthomonas gei]|uniref:TetR/AcrR family transcriptional regulator n=1 Tax=Pseudoxanthomonas gei TaxID=1383030 RepID=A0ABX0AAQ5_9GAMM|nr:TetR/AcrR family transcriptional regulator [Pseudoxanthomonas gei]NDK38622.1 TetR/AcrR family transcriptional regulator [Pseudoxanthomonas gei]
MDASTSDSIAGGADLAVSLRPRPAVDLCKRGELRVERFLDAATEVFTEKGYQHARLSEIVARAGGSLATLYRVFGDKEGLAHAIIRRRLQDLSARLQDLNLSGLSPEDALQQAAERIAEGMCTAESVVIHRIVIGEGQSFPGMRDWFFDHAVAAVRTSLADYFEQEMAAGRLKLASSSLAASQFFMMLFGDLVIRVSSGNLKEPDPQELRSYAQNAVQLFLHGALPR